MKKSLMLSIVGLFALSAGNLLASQIPCPTVPTTCDVLAAATGGSAGGIANGCYSQDKLFFNFVYIPTDIAGAASTVQAGLIFQTAGALDIHGWNFSSSSWVQGSGGLADFTIGYTMEVCPAGSACVGAVVPGTLITGANAVYAPVSLFPPGNETVNWSNGANATLTSGSPGPLPANGNISFSGVGPISVSAVFTGTGAITQTTLRFYETVPSGIPEPVTMALMGSSLLGLGLLRLRTVKKSVFSNSSLSEFSERGWRKPTSFSVYLASRNFAPPRLPRATARSTRTPPLPFPALRVS